MNLISRHLATHGISQTAFARQIGVSQPTVHAWTTGKARPEGDNLLRVAEAIDLPVEDVVLHFHMPESASGPGAAA